MSGVLEGVVVLDLTQMLAGPYCTMMLADHGADVIKIEPPGGDISRTFGPFFEDDTERQYGGYFNSINRNKRSLVLDLKDAGDAEKFRQLVAKADVLVENYRAGVMERLDLGYEALAAVNPQIVYATIRGFGDERTGNSPYADWPAFDIVAQAMGGFMGITGPGEPMKAGPGVGDIFPGALCAFGVVAALRKAERTGEGQFLDVPMYDAMVSLCERIVHLYTIGGVMPKPEGNNHPLAAPFSIYQAKDGWVAIACPVDSLWQRLAEAIGQPELAADPAFATNVERAKRSGEVQKILDEWCSQFTKLELAERLGGLVPFGPVNDTADVVNDPHIVGHDMVTSLDIPVGNGAAKIAGTPVRFAKTPGGVRSRGPLLGEHSGEILAQFDIH
ncbi:MAG: CoA transferase [Pseudomonadota bacterium]